MESCREVYAETFGSGVVGTRGYLLGPEHLRARVFVLRFGRRARVFQGRPAPMPTIPLADVVAPAQTMISVVG
jgi:hypothetical protein